ncbi:rhoGEF domain-containing protein [Ditylenchus destructor]|nr:rhoGEF domain-containing protein [Ditylenchus destructor]
MANGERELWIQCVDWLMSTGLLDSSASPRLSKPADLASMLRDGVLLCELALILQPGCIDRRNIFMVNRMSPFMWSKNISLFLDACQKYFGLNEVSFDGQDTTIYDISLEDFGRVLRILSLLSHTSQALRLNLRPFPDHTPTTNGAYREVENQIYCNLRDQVEEMASSADDTQQYDFIGNYPSTADEKKREEIYDCILTQRVPKTKVESAPTNERGFCIKEILDTESNYCDALNMIIETFYNKLKHKLSTDNHNTIFMNMKNIYLTHQKFLQKLTPAALNALGIDDPSCVDGKENLHMADVFVQFKMDFVAYAPYCSLLKSAVGKIDELERTDTDLRQYLNELSKSAKFGSHKQSQFKLQDLLVVPMQRILKYQLLLQQLAKTTSDVSEQQQLSDAIEAMADVSYYINEVKRDHEAIEVISHVQRSVIMQDGVSSRFDEHGRLLQDGLVKISDYEETTRRPKQRYIFLFEKLMMVCKQKGNTSLYDFRKAHLLSEYELIEDEPEITSKTSTLSRKLTSGFFDNTNLTLVRKGFKGDNASSANLQLIFKSLQQREAWKKELKKAIEINCPSKAIAKGHNLLYKTYSHAVSCTICRKLLAGKFYQGYHCSGCDKDMHFDCCHVQNCSRKPVPASRTKTNSISSIIQPFRPGDLVVSRQSISSTDSSRLSCNSGDVIEVIDWSMDGTIVGRLTDLPGRTGKIAVDFVMRFSGTMRKSTSERGRMSTGSIENNIDRPVSLVSTAIINSSEGISDITQQPWYFSELGREQANQLLESTESGTFIVRHSVQQQQFVISLRYDGKAKHMKIEYDNITQNYYLHDGRLFTNILDLINFYRSNSLSEAFNNLDTTLRATLLRTNLYKVLFDYDGNDPVKYLTLRRGDIVTVLDTVGENKGWWKGKISRNSTELSGFFPISYVESMNPEHVESYTFNSNGEREPQHLLVPSVSQDSKDDESTL